MPSSEAGTKLQTWLSDGEDVGISSIAWSEFLCGPLTDTHEKLAQLLFPRPMPFLAADAYKAAELFNKTGRRSRSLADCQIAAAALRCGARMATTNEADFILFGPHGMTLQ